MLIVELEFHRPLESLSQSFSFELRFSVFVERLERAALINRARMKAVYGDTASENDLLHSGLASGVADLDRSLNIYVVISGDRAHVMTVLGGKINDHRGVSKHTVK